MKLSSVKLCLFFLFLFSMNFYNSESRIILILFLAVVLFIQGWKLPITPTGMLLAAYSVIYYGFAAIYNPSMLTFYIIPFLLAPFLGYSIGMILMRTIEFDKTKMLRIIIYIVVAGRFAHGMLNFIASNGYRGYLRNGIDFWTKGILAATGQGALMTMAISLLFYGVLILKRKNVLEKGAVLLAVALSTVNSLLSASRTAIIIMIVVFLVCTIVFIFLSKESRQQKRKMVIGLILLFATLFLLYRSDIFGVRTYWETSPLYERINTESDYQVGDENRLEMIFDAFGSAWDNPLGDGDMTTTAHNLWLDALKQTGWLTFTLLVAFTVIVVKRVIKLLRNDSVSQEIKYLVFSVILSTLINFAVEPIMRGMPYYFVAFCIIAGAIEEYEKSSDNYSVPIDLEEGRKVIFLDDDRLNDKIL